MGRPRCTTLVLDYENARLIKVKHPETDDFRDLFTKHFGGNISACEFLTVEGEPEIQELEVT